jgi:L-threonylcarbamoyladenylate synthase
METKRLNGNNDEDLREAGRIIADGGLVAFPTETVFGLGANALDEDAVARVYEAKGRPSDNPMIVHISRASDIGQLTRFLSPTIVNLIETFWPGPLTLVVKKREAVPYRTTGGLETVAVRMPDSPIARAIINYADVPIAAPSANISGRPSPTRTEDVVADLDGKVDAIVDGPDCRVGIESTVLDVTGEVPTVLRPGIITPEQIEAAIGKRVALHPSLLERPDGGGQDPHEAAAAGEAGGSAQTAPRYGEPDPDSDNDNGPRVTSGDFVARSPGMKYKHYAPKADMLIVEGERGDVKAEIERLKALNEGLGNKVGVLLFEEQAFIEAAHDFFARLRDLDREGVDLILAGALSDRNSVGFAVMNRMLKSAGYNIVKV